MWKGHVPDRNPRALWDDDPRWWVEAILGDSASTVSQSPSSVCATGTIASTRVCLCIEQSANPSESGAALALRAIAIAQSTGALLLTVLVDDGVFFADADLGRWLRGAHRLSGVTPHLALSAGATAARARLRLGTADLVARVGIVSDDADAAFGTPAAAIEWIRTAVALLPENNAVVVPEGERLAPEVIDAPDAVAGGQELVEIIADEPPLIVRDAGVVLSLCRIDGQTVATIASGLGGSPNAADVRAVTRLISLCDAFHLPVVIVWDSVGPTGAGEEINALARAIAESAIPLVTVVIGRALGALGLLLTSVPLGVCEVLAWPHARIGNGGLHSEVHAQQPPDDARRAATLSTLHGAAQDDVPGADRVIAPENSLLEIHAALIRWGTVDDATPVRRRGVPTR